MRDANPLEFARPRSIGLALLRVLVALVLVALHWRVRATLPWGFTLSPSATLRVAGANHGD
jgi:hypothetical protein